MTHGLHDLSRHNTWATAQTITFCRGLDEQQLNTTVPGTFGTIIEMLRHTINSESSYLNRLSGDVQGFPWDTETEADLDLLEERAARIAAAWERYLAGDVDTEKLGPGRGDNGEVFAVRFGIFITQAFHHANEHRAQIGTVIGSLGLEAPDVSAWGYALESGRSTLTSRGS
ncbi:MAG: DinB family protein [Thermomicrobiales bacterium]